MNTKARFCAMAAGLAGFWFAGCFGMSNQLLQHGVSASATIEELWDTGWTINEDPVIGMKVRVQPADGQPFEAVIKHTEVSRLSVPQFQPGQVIPVRYDPKDISQVAFDYSGGTSAPVGPSSGNPYKDHFAQSKPQGAVFLPAPSAPAAYLGTGDSAADSVALVENGYAPLGGARADRGSDPAQAIEEGKEVGAAVVVLYGHFDAANGNLLEILPFKRVSDASQPLDAATLSVPALDGGQQFAMYWGRLQRPVLGVYSRPLSEKERASLHSPDGLAVEAVAGGSPAMEAGIRQGDVMVSVDGKTINSSTMQNIILSLAGHKVTIEVIRGGQRMSIPVQLGSTTKN
jgi:hypothetical protein